MKITFLIGNGFDISLGVDSSYSSFYRWYCKTSSDKEHIKMFKEDIENDINRDISDEERTWADFELGLGKYTSKFTKESVEEYLDCVEDAQEKIVTYLREQENKFHLNDFLDDSFKEFKQCFVDFFDEVSDSEKQILKEAVNRVQNENREVTIITFNYTNTLERLLAKIPDAPLAPWRNGPSTYAYKINRNIIHVHGTTEDFPVLGVNDESQIDEKSLIEIPDFREILIKAENVNALGKLWHSQAEEQISKSKFVCVFGMSLGASDAKWWRKLVQWLKADGTRHLILYWYEKNPPNGISARRQFACINSTKNKLLSYSELSENDIRSIRPRIHVIINTSKFLRLERANEVDFSVENDQNSINELLGVPSVTREDVEAILAEKVKDSPVIRFGTESPNDLKNGEIYFQYDIT